MSELHTYYARRLIWMLIGVLFVSGFLDRLEVTNFLSNHYVLIALLLGGELLIRKWLWKLEKPSLNFSGRWRGSTTYSRRWLDGSGALPEAAPHEVHIKQDCLSVSIEPTGADAFAQWGSLICDLVPKGIAYAYEVTYNDRPGFPAKARGYEDLKVVGSGRRGLPRTIAGGFHHFVGDDQPVFSGVVKFDRVPGRRPWRLGRGS